MIRLNLLFPSNISFWITVYKTVLERLDVLEPRGPGVALVERDTAYSGGILECLFGFEGADSQDLTNAISPIAISDVLDDALSSILRKVDVDIWHRDAGRIQESLEHQTKL